MTRLLFVSLTALFFAGCSSSTQTTQPITSNYEACGSDRWATKNLLDADTLLVNFTPVDVTLAQIDSIEQIAVGDNTPRLELERTTVRVSGTIWAVKKEDDNDIHVLLQDTAGHMVIGEIPTCPDMPGGHVAQFNAAYQWLVDHNMKPTTAFKYYSQPATLTGVRYMDPVHGQKGASPSGVELHPILSIE